MSSLYIAFDLNNQDKNKLMLNYEYLKNNAEGDFVDPTTFHITCTFLSKDQNNINEAINGLKLFKEKYTVNKVNLYAKDFCMFEQGVMWMGVHNSMPLYIIKKNIEQCLIESGFPLKKDKFGQYIPHITMGYDVKPFPSLNRQFTDIDLCIDGLSLWASPKCNDTYITNCIYKVDFK